MNKKKTFIILASVIIIAGLFSGLIWLQTNFTLFTKENISNISNNMVSIEVSGFKTSSYSNPSDYNLFQNKDGNWINVLDDDIANFYSDYSESRYLDGNFIPGMSIIGLPSCTKIDKPININLVKQIKVGEKDAPKTGPFVNWVGEGKYPEYKTVPLSGEIKIEVQYFKDKYCKDKKVFSKIINK